MLTSRLLWRWNAFILPLVAAPSIWFADPLCHSLLHSPGVEEPLARLYQLMTVLQ